MYSKETSKDAMQDASSRRYHHGDLRSAVIDTALNMLREEKGWQFTLREVARRAGVSHAAPYKHFPDKAALLVELAMIDEFTSLARAYVTFGTDNPALYRLMFSAEEGKTVGMHLSERALAVFNVALEILLRGQAAGGIRKRPVEGQAAACWGLVHGLTLLAIDGLLIPEKVGPSPLDAALNTLVEGLENPSHMTQ
jgi:AcrR family transcriptional regulator